MAMERLKNKAHTLLRKSEGIFRTDMVYLARGGFWVSFSQISNAVLSLVLMVSMANLLDKESYGTYKYILSIAGMLSILTLTGMNRAVSQAVAAGHEGVLRPSVKYQLKWNILMVLGFLATAIYYLYQGNTLLSSALLILALPVPMTYAFNTYSAYLEGKKQFALNNIFSVISTAVYVGGLLIVLILDKEVPWLIAAYAGTTLVSSFVFYITTVKFFRSIDNENTESLKFGKELTAIGLLGPIVSYLDSIILAHFWGATHLAIYSIARSIPERGISFIKSLVNLGFPKFVEKNINQINQIFYRRIVQGLIVGILCAAIYILVAPFLFSTILPQYLDSTLYSQIFSLSLIFAMPNRYISLLLESQMLSKTIFINSLVQNGTKLALYLVLCIWGGIIGLVLAQVLHSAISLIINIIIWKSQKSHPEIAQA